MEAFTINPASYIEKDRKAQNGTRIQAPRKRSQRSKLQQSVQLYCFVAATLAGFCSACFCRLWRFVAHMLNHQTLGLADASLEPTNFFGIALLTFAPQPCLTINHICKRITN